MEIFCAAHFQVSISSPDSHPSYTLACSVEVISNSSLSHCPLNVHSNGSPFILCVESFLKDIFASSHLGKREWKLHLKYFNLEYLGLSKLIAL